jgi:lauroyl/myristoyl acyltransferase
MVARSRVPVIEGDAPVPKDDRTRDVSLAARIYGNPNAHRLLPASVALPLVARVGPAIRQQRNPAERRDAELFMSALLEHTPRASQAPELAQRWLAQKSRIGEIFWRPWLASGSSVEGLEHWHAARKGGQGAVLVFGHILATWALPAILTTAGLAHYIVIGGHYYDPIPPGYPGIALLHRRKAWGEAYLARDHIVLTSGRPERLSALVGAGAVVAVAFDAPGRAATPFLGRTIGIGGGAARLAIDTGVKLLPAAPELHGSHFVLRFHQPLDPADYADAPALRAAIAATFEPIVLARPEDLELAWNPSPLISDIEG